MTHSATGKDIVMTTAGNNTGGPARTNSSPAATSRSPATGDAVRRHLRCRCRTGPIRGWLGARLAQDPSAADVDADQAIAQL